MMYVVYALYNQVVDKVYIGQTKNLSQRLALHKNHYFINSFTSRYLGNWTLFYTEEFTTRVDALKREAQLKSYRGREFLRNNIPR